MRSLGFGTERCVWPVLRWPLASGIVFLLGLAAIVYGVTQVRFNDDLRSVFAGKTQAYENYVEAAGEFVDPENEILILVEGPTLGNAATLPKLLQLQYDLQLLDGVSSVFSMFSLRSPPDANGDAAPVLGPDTIEITPSLRDTIRAHPLLGTKLLSADGRTALFVVTPEEARASLDVTNKQKEAVIRTAADALAGTGLTATLTGFAVIRSDLVDIMVNDQILLNIAGAIIGIVMSLIVFRSFTAAIMTAVPAILAGASVLGFMGLIGVKMTIMSNVVPAFVMIIGYADAMHLSFAWRHHRNLGASPREAERLAQAEIGPACMLTAITTALAFLSLTISDVSMVSEFGWMGGLGTMAGAMIVLIGHALLTFLIGRFWKPGTIAGANLLSVLRRPSADICRFSIRRSRPIEIVAVVAFVVLAGMHFSVPPQHAIREHLPADNPANAALGRLDQALDGAYPVQVVVPLHGLSPTSAEAIDRVGKIHKAVAAVDGANTPLSLWSLVEWLGGPEAALRGDALATVVDQLEPGARSRFLSANGSTLVSITVNEASTQVLAGLIDRIEAAARAAGGNDVVVTGVAAITARESDRTIRSLNLSLSLAILSGLGAMVLAFRDWRIGVVSFLPNALPIVCVGAILFLSGRGMQYTSVLSLTVAFGIAIDTSIHFLNRYRMQVQDAVETRLVEAARHIGPVLVGTTLIIIAGLTTTFFSVLPTVRLFGELATATLAAALVSDLIILPAFMAGVARRWFVPLTRRAAAPAKAPADG